MPASNKLNRSVTTVADILEARGAPPWSETLIDDGRNNVTLIASGPGHSNDAHVHPDFNEWWLVMEGELEWEVGDYPPVRAVVGDVVMSPAGTRHLITTVSDQHLLTARGRQVRLEPRYERRARASHAVPA